MPAYRKMSDRLEYVMVLCHDVDFLFGIVDALGTCELGLRYIHIYKKSDND